MNLIEQLQQEISSMDLASSVEYLVSIVVVVVGVVVFRLHFNRHVYGSRFPFFDLFRRLFRRDTRAKAKKQTLQILFFFAVLFGGMLLILLLK